MEGAEKFKDWRLNKGLTQREAANMLSVTSLTVSFWELGKVQPSDLNKKAIERVTGIQWDNPAI
jgi:transcriptional regulator with XRE-family HTH domain